MSNYPPGVTGCEPQITGGDDAPSADPRVLSMTPVQIVSIARRDCIERHGRIRWEVRSAPVDREDWDGTTWNLIQLAQFGKATKRYLAEAYKEGPVNSGAMPVETYEIVLPHQFFKAGRVFRQTMIVVNGETTFGFAEVHLQPTEAAS